MHRLSLTGVSGSGSHGSQSERSTNLGTRWEDPRERKAGESEGGVDDRLTHRDRCTEPCLQAPHPPSVVVPSLSLCLSVSVFLSENHSFSEPLREKRERRQMKENADEELYV